MSNQTIELHEAKINNECVDISYSIGDADVNMQISKAKLLDFVIDNEMNLVYITAPDVLTEVCAENYLEDNISDIVTEYLNENSCEK